VTALDPTAPTDPIVWAGGPALRPRREDLLAATAAFAATALVLCGGLVFVHGAPPARALQLGLGYSAIVAAITGLARVAGAGTLTMLLAAFFLPISVAALTTGQAGLSLVCPLASATSFLGLFLLRWRQRRATRYWITASGACMGEVGRYLISFPILAPPLVRPDRFGAGLGDIDFGRVQARLVTRDGRTFQLPPRRCRFRRVVAPEQVVAAIAGRGPSP
jgi:hypothetical protein